MAKFRILLLGVSVCAVTVAQGPSPSRVKEVSKDTAPAAVPQPLGQMVDIGGRRLHLICSGKGSPTVLLENGSDGFSIDWALVQPQVAKFTRVCAYDRAGFAWSDRGPAINTVEQTMDDLHLLLRTASLSSPFVLVGHSIGGMFVRAYQRRYPNEVAGLVLVDATPEEDLGYSVNGVNKTGVDMTYEEMETVFEPLLKNPPPKPKLWPEGSEPFNRLPPELERARRWASGQWFAQIDMAHSWITAESWREEFASLRRMRLSRTHMLGDLPLVVLHRGRRTDPVLDAREAAMARMSSAGVERVAAESDHYIQLWQPDAVTAAIREVSVKARMQKTRRVRG